VDTRSNAIPDSVTDRPAIRWIDGRGDLPAGRFGQKAHGLDVLRRLGLRTPTCCVLPLDVVASFDGGTRLPEAVWKDVVDAVHRIEHESGEEFGGTRRPLLLAVRSGAAQSMPGVLGSVLNVGMTPALRDHLAMDAARASWAVSSWEGLARSWRASCGEGTGPPTGVYQQLGQAILAVRDSWYSPTANAYRAHRGLAGGLGTAVILQRMVFGNLGDGSGSGVALSCDPRTGALGLTGEWTRQSQGERVVSGQAGLHELHSLVELDAQIVDELLEGVDSLRAHFNAEVEVEFVVEGARLFFVQVRSFDLTGLSVVAEPQLGSIGPGVISGLAVSSGKAAGIVAATASEAERLREAGARVVLFRRELTISDIPELFEIDALLTTRGGFTSHAALICRQIGIPCVTGCDGEVMQSLIDKPVIVDGDMGTVHVPGVSDESADAREPAAVVAVASSIVGHVGGRRSRRLSDAEFDVLHALRMKGRAPLEKVVDAAGLGSEDAQRAITSLTVTGLVVARHGRAAGLSATEDGLVVHVQELVRRCPETLSPMTLNRFYELNDRFKALGTRWQIDSSDASREAILNEFTEVRSAARAVIRELALALPWMTRYATRLDAAFERLFAGDHSALLAPLSESCHDIWMELHHDLRLALVVIEERAA
jgi:pyruvate,orthophosphate dikinase